MDFRTYTVGELIDTLSQFPRDQKVIDYRPADYDRGEQFTDLLRVTTVAQEDHDRWERLCQSMIKNGGNPAETRLKLERYRELYLTRPPHGPKVGWETYKDCILIVGQFDE